MRGTQVHRFVDTPSIWKLFRTQLYEVVVWILCTGHPAQQPCNIFLFVNLITSSPAQDPGGLAVILDSL